MLRKVSSFYLIYIWIKPIKVQNDFAENKIDCHCDQRCNDDYWRLQYSTLSWPAENFEPYLYGTLADSHPEVAAKLVDRKYTMENIVELNVYYEELNQQG